LDLLCGAIHARRFSRGVHNAGRLTFEVAVRYPYHPLSGQSVLVVGETEHGGALHLIVRKPSGAKLLLPAWMTFPESSAVTILSCPRLSVNRLLELRALLDRLMASSSPHHVPGGGRSNEPTETPPSGSVQDTPRTYPVAAYDSSGATQGASDRSDIRTNKHGRRRGAIDGGRKRR